MISNAQYAEPTGLFLLFAKGKRPNRAAIKEFAQNQRAVSISHDPSGEPPLQLVTTNGQDVRATSSDQSRTSWLELLRDGLTFDLQGLAPGDACEFASPDFRFDLDASPNSASHSALKLVPGRHLSGGERTMPVARGMVAIARDLIQHFDDLESVIWPHSASAIGRRYFESSVTAWLEGGPFPALGLTAFRETSDNALQSVGLDFWIGQEIRIEPPLSVDRVAATRLGVRIINQMVLVGGLEVSERVTAPDGTPLVLRPSRNGKFIRVWRE